MSSDSKDISSAEKVTDSFKVGDWVTGIGHVSGNKLIGTFLSNLDYRKAISVNGETKYCKHVRRLTKLELALK